MDKSRRTEAEDEVRLGEYLRSMHEVLGSSPSTGISQVWWHTCNPSIHDGGRRIKSSRYPWLHSKFDASLGYMGPCLQQNKIS